MVLSGEYAFDEVGVEFYVQRFFFSFCVFCCSFQGEGKFYESGGGQEFREVVY